jgi:hypothetical protein
MKYALQLKELAKSKVLQRMSSGRKRSGRREPDLHLI